MNFRLQRSMAMGVLLSIVWHLLLLLILPEHKEIDGEPLGAPPPPLEVSLSTPLIAAVPVPPQPPPPPPPPPRERILSVPKPISKSPMPTVQEVPDEIVPALPRPPEPVRVPVVPTQPTPPVDASNSLMARIEAARARREGEEAAIARMNSEARGSGRDPRAAALESNVQSLGRSREGTSGVFQILDKGHRTASFSFRGWSGDRSNSTKQVIEVDAGQGGNVEIAIVRRMIALIREHYQGSFQWESHRLGRVITLSARMEDNAGLERFLLTEFFG